MTAQVFNGMAVTLSGTSSERAATLAQIKALPQVISSAISLPLLTYSAEDPKPCLS